MRMLPGQVWCQRSAFAASKPRRLPQAVVQMLHRCLMRAASRSTGLATGCDLTKFASVGHARLQHSASASASDPAQRQHQARSVDPFTSALQNKTEKELMEQMLRQAEEQEQAEDAAEQVIRFRSPETNRALAVH